MPRHSETKHLPYSPEQLFDLVADVARYDEFLPWVVAVRIRSSSETETVADIGPIQIQAEEEHNVWIPTAAAIAAVLAGLGLVIAGRKAA